MRKDGWHIRKSVKCVCRSLQQSENKWYIPGGEGRKAMPLLGLQAWLWPQLEDWGGSHLLPPARRVSRPCPPPLSGHWPQASYSPWHATHAQYMHRPLARCLGSYKKRSGSTTGMRAGWLAAAAASALDFGSLYSHCRFSCGQVL